MQCIQVTLRHGSLVHASSSNENGIQHMVIVYDCDSPVYETEEHDKLN